MRSLSTLSRALPVFLLPLILAAGCQRQSPTASAQGAFPSGALAADSTSKSSSADTLTATPAPFATPPLLPGTPDVAALVAKIKPSVVNITTIHEMRQQKGDENSPFGIDPFFPFGPGRRGGGDQVFKQQALGSGFLVGSKGHVVTNAHVVDAADQVKVKLSDDREF